MEFAARTRWRQQTLWRVLTLGSALAMMQRWAKRFTFASEVYVVRQLALIPIVAAAALALGSAPASAQDAWPIDPGPGHANRPVDVTNYVLTPDQLNFWNPAVGIPRVVSPFGRTTKIVCTGYRAYDNCWQADQNGNPRKLNLVFNMGVFGSLTSVPAQSLFMYPDFIPGS